MKEEKEKNSLPLLIIIIVAVWLIITVVIWFVFKDWNQSGPFGDTFGAVNSLFSGLALAGIIYTIHLQKTELSLQRKELQYTREELKRTADAQESSGKILTEQIRINNIPFIDFDSRITPNEGVTIKIINQSDNPAYDLDVWLLIPVDQEEVPFENYINENINKNNKERIKLTKEKLVDGILWSLCDKGIYNYLSKGKAISIDLTRYLPIEAKFVHLFIQYRDVLGNNYYKHASFIRTDDLNKPYFDDAINPVTPEVVERLDLSKKLKNITDIEKHKEVLALFKASIHVKHAKDIGYGFLEQKWEVVPW